MENINLTFLFENRIPALIIDGMNGEEKRGIIDKLLGLSNIEYIKHYENINYCELFTTQILDF